MYTRSSCCCCCGCSCSCCSCSCVLYAIIACYVSWSIRIYIVYIWNVINNGWVNRKSNRNCVVTVDKFNVNESIINRCLKRCRFQPANHILHGINDACKGNLSLGIGNRVCVCVQYVCVNVCMCVCFRVSYVATRSCDHSRACPHDSSWYLPFPRTESWWHLPPSACVDRF